MEKKICSECGTENEKEYIYCKNCGAPLSSVKKRRHPRLPRPEDLHLNIIMPHLNIQPILRTHSKANTLTIRPAALIIRLTALIPVTV